MVSLRVRKTAVIHAMQGGSVVCRGIFGDTCTLQRVQEEMLGYSDFGLHRFALNQGAKFADFLLDPEHLMDSAKCRALSELLPKLKVGASAFASVLA